MRADDPLAPGQVLDWPSEVGPFPVQDSCDRIGGRVEQDIIWPIVAVNQDTRNLARTASKDRRGINRVDAPEHLPARPQDVFSPASLDQVLTMDTDHEGRA